MDDEEHEIQPHHFETMNDIAAILDECFKGYGFMLMVFDLNKDPGTGFINYISNSERADVCKAMLEFVARSGAEGKL
jgi:hypothetical protein